MVNGKKAVILQPTYLPWCGYFAMMDLADVFVFYDDAQLSVQSWQQRNRIKTPNGVKWLTIPIHRNQGQKICDTGINYSTSWLYKHWKTIEQSYSKAPFYNAYAHYIIEFYKVKWYLLSDYCMYITRVLAMGLNIDMPEIYQSSALYSESSRTDRVISILKNLGATEYISGSSAKAYIEPEKFDEAGIKLTWFDYKHPTYPQIRGDFVPYLSVIDLLFNAGEDSIKYIREGYEKRKE